jgi:hypothetical protein
MTEDKIYQIHSEIANTLQDALNHFKDREEMALSKLREAQRQRSYIQKAVENGEWWKLEDYLEPAELEFISEVEPSDRLSLIYEPWEQTNETI